MSLSWMPPRKSTGYRGIFHLIMIVAVWPPVVVLFAVIGSGTMRLSLLGYAVTGLLMSIVSVATNRTVESGPGWVRLRKVDHTMIIVFVAGTFTPIATALDRPRAWLVLIVMWLLVPVRGALAWLDWDRKRWVTAVVAIVSGALPLAALSGLGRPLTTVLVVGQVTYVIAAIIYNVERPNPWPSWCGYHGVFHGFTNVGSVLHLVVICLLIAVPTAALVLALVIAVVVALVVARNARSYR